MSFLAPLLGFGAPIVGSLISKLFSNNKESDLFTKPAQLKEFERFSPEQKQLQQTLLNALTGSGEGQKGGLLGELLGEKGFESYAAPARREFTERTVPALAERFSGIGSGSQRSSAFQQQLAQAGATLSEKLAELHGRKRQDLLGNLLAQVMQPQKNQIYEPEAPTGLARGLSSFGHEATSSLLPILSNILQSKFSQGGSNITRLLQ